MNRVKEISKLIQKFKAHHYTEYIQGKKVIIVGPNTNLEGQGLGKYIDGFDRIIRVNTVFEYLPFSSEKKKDYGSRTDILYFSPSCMKKYANKKSTFGRLKENHIKYIVYQNGNRDRKYFTGGYCYLDALAYYKEIAPIVGFKLHFSHHSTMALTDMMNDMKLSKHQVVPRTGFIPILDMLIHGAKSVETVGMSFSEGGGHSFRPDAIKKMQPTLTHTGKPSPHDSSVEEALTRELMKEYPTILTDFK